MWEVDLMDTTDVEDENGDGASSYDHHKARERDSLEDLRLWRRKSAVLFTVMTVTLIASSIRDDSWKRSRLIVVVYYESIKRELQIRPIYECRCDERLQTKTKEFTGLTYTGLVVELEHLKIKTMLTNEKFESLKFRCDWVPF